MRMRGFVLGVIAGISAAAIGQELQKPPIQRTWKGEIGGIPYNFRVNEWQEIAREYWNPSSEALLTPHTIGVGWGVNFAALSRRAQDLLETAQTQVSQRKAPVIDATTTTTHA